MRGAMRGGARFHRIGGDCFALYAPRGGADVLAYNGSGRTPRALTIDWFEDRGLTEVPRQSPSAVTIPGAIDAWTRLHADHGRLSLSEILAPAIRYAEKATPSRHVFIAIGCGRRNSWPPIKRRQRSSCLEAARHALAKCTASRS